MGYYYREKKFDHPGQTSLDITGRVIDAFTNENDTVMDFFMGVGTTGYWCATHSRNFVGIEINETYFKIAKRRIDEALMQPKIWEQQWPPL